MNSIIAAVRSIYPQGVLRMWQRNWTIFRKVFWQAMAPTFFEPVIYLIGLGVGLGFFVKRIEGMSYIQFIAPGLLASTVMFGASFETTYNSFIRMKFQKTYDAVLATPLGIEDVIVGEILWGTTRGYLNALVFLAVITLLGMVKSPTALLLLPLLLLFAALFAIIGMLFTALVSNILLFNYYFTLFITPIFIFSGIFYPITALPIWAQRLAWFTPLYHVVIACRGLALGNQVTSVIMSIIWIAVVDTVLFLIPVTLMRKRLIK